jgi:hypothetical protein
LVPAGRQRAHEVVVERDEQSDALENALYGFTDKTITNIEVEKTIRERKK